MEEMIARLIEQNVVSGAFILLLWYVLNKQDKQLGKFADSLEKTTQLLGEISIRLQRLEERGDRDAD
jgi:glutaredoxin 2